MWTYVGHRLYLGQTQRGENNDIVTHHFAALLPTYRYISRQGSTCHDQTDIFLGVTP